MCVLCVADVCVVCCRLLMCCCCVMEARGEAPAASVLPGVDPGGRPLLWPRSGSVASAEAAAAAASGHANPASITHPALPLPSSSSSSSPYEDVPTFFYNCYIV
uniref:Secreted protein n=1 Tax=Knipowitschia caucasica TaxID=637954 RepID=A0AAV2KVP1_KNICA